VSSRVVKPLVGVTSIALVLTAFWFALDSTSPGPLSNAHAQDPSLLASDGCDLCHGSVLTGMRAACADCHAEVDAQVSEGRGFHGALDDGADCAECHGEHHGRAFEPVGRRSFALAGFAERDDYDHGGLAFQPDGAHAELTCAQCHAHADDTVLAAGTTRFLGLDGRCDTCHEDPHEGRMVDACSTCHDQGHAFDDFAEYAHTAEFPLTGGHGRSDCLDCHARDGAHAIEVLVTPDAPPARGCAACHEDPHRAGFSAGAARITGRAVEASCELCHDAAHDGFVEGADAFSPALHAATGFALDAPHDVLACADCHADGYAFGDAPPRAADDCAACHADPHGDQFDGTGCLDCHAAERFVPVAFGLDDHAASAFPLTGTHAAVSCADCHREPPAGDPRAFRGTPQDCGACHADAHAGAFAGTGCGECHDTTLFADVAHTDFEHGPRTGFALDGAHARATCESCHRRTPAPDAAWRTFGRVADVFGEPTGDCATCHADAHDGRLLDTDGCDDCHVTESFRLLLAGRFEHARSTGVELRGAHAEADCAACHARTPVPDAAHRTFGRARAIFGEPLDDCSTCHADPHGGTFANTGRTDCARCHDETRFAPARPGSFEHAAATGYALDGPHAAPDCAACHPRTTGGRFGRAPGTDCAACHVDPHVGQFTRGGRTDCARCHADATTLVFDHQRDARFALDEQHARLDCNACHVRWPLPGGGDAVRYRPLGTECGACHAPSGGAPR
jgi:hypothetical protein